MYTVQEDSAYAIEKLHGHLQRRINTNSDEIVEIASALQRLKSGPSEEIGLSYILSNKNTILQSMPELSSQFGIVEYLMKNGLSDVPQMTQAVDCIVKQCGPAYREAQFQAKKAEKQTLEAQNKIFTAILEGNRKGYELSDLIEIIETEGFKSSDEGAILLYEIYETCEDEKTLEVHPEIQKTLNFEPEKPEEKQNIEPEILAELSSTEVAEEPKEEMPEEVIKTIEKEVKAEPKINTTLLEQVMSVMDSVSRYKITPTYDDNYFSQLLELDSQTFSQTVEALQDEDRAYLEMMRLKKARQDILAGKEVDIKNLQSAFDDITSFVEARQENSEVFEKETAQIYALIDQNGLPYYDFDINEKSITKKIKENVSTVMEKIKHNLGFRPILLDDGERGYFSVTSGKVICAIKKVADSENIIVNIDARSKENFYATTQAIISNKPIKQQIDRLEESIIEGTLSEEELENQQQYIEQLGSAYSR